MAILERKLARGYKGLIEISVLYDDKSLKIIGIKTTNNSGKVAKPLVKTQTASEVSKVEVGELVKLKEEYFMVVDKEFGNLITPSGFEVELNIPFA